MHKILQHKAEGAILRSSIRWYLEGEKNTQMFLNLEKSKARNRTMNAVRLHSGEVTKNPTKILQSQHDFYEKLYTKDPEVQFVYQNEDRPVLTQDKSTELDKEITVEELSTALKEMANQKTPGPDGWTAEFYKFFWKYLKDPLLKVIQEDIKTGKIHVTSRQGVITLLPKKRDLLLVKHWRPICLLCIDYKLYSKILANRMKTVMESLISPNQTGFMKGRTIGDNVRKAADIMEYTVRKNLAAVLISIDFEKAFDRVTYESLYEVLRYFRFGEKFVIIQRSFLRTSNYAH